MSASVAPKRSRTARSAGRVDRPLRPDETPRERDAIRETTLPSGRRVALAVGAGGERVEVRAPSGDLEVTIRLTAEGPVVSLRGATLELEAAGAVKIACDTFEVDAKSAASVRSGGELKLTSAEDTRIHADGELIETGTLIRLN